MPKQDLADILGKSGDFQFSFAIEDLITPAIESIDKASHVLMTFFEKQSKELSKDFKAGNKMLKTLLDKEGKKAEKVTKKVTDGLKKGKKEAKGLGKEMGVFGKILDSINWTAFQEGMENLVGGNLVKAADEIISVMTNVANTLGKTRTQMLGLAREVATAATALSEYGISARDSMDAIEGLVKAGAREEAQLKRLAPQAALVTKAIGGDSSSVAAAFFALEDRMGISGEMATQIFANMKKASTELRYVGVEELTGSILDPKRLDQIQVATRGMAAENRQQMLLSMTNIMAALESTGAESGEFIDKIVGSMTDPEIAAKLGALVSMSGSQVKESLQTAEGAEQFLDNLLGTLGRYKGAPDQYLKPVAEALGITTENLGKLAEATPQVSDAFDGLQGTMMGVAKSQDYSREKAEENLGFIDKWSNKISNWATTWDVFGFTLTGVFNALKDFPVLEIMAIMPLLTSLAGWIIPTLTTLFPSLAAAITVFQASLGFATLAVMDFWAVTLAPALVAAGPWIALAAAIGAAAYLIYTYFDEIKAAGMKVWDFFMGTGPLEEGWLGTVQGILRYMTIPLRIGIKLGGILYDVFSMLGDVLYDYFLASLKQTYDDMKALGELIVWATTEFLKFTGIHDDLVLIKDIFEGIYDWITKSVEAAGGLAKILTDALKGAINKGIIDPMNARINTPVFGKTLGERLGVAEIPRLAEGAVVMGPTIAQVAEERPEAVIPLDQYQSLLHAAAMANAGGGTTVLKPASPNVIVAQDRVVAAVNELNRTLREFMRKGDLPTKGTGFGASSAASPRGF